VKLSVNVFLSLAAIAALVQLLPYRSNQEAKLQELQTTVASTHERVEQIQTRFSNYFDPSQGHTLMQQQSNRIDPRRVQVIWQKQAPAPVVNPQSAVVPPAQ